jgi:hypothetical protein
MAQSQVRDGVNDRIQFDLQRDTEWRLWQVADAISDFFDRKGDALNGAMRPRIARWPSGRAKWLAFTRLTAPQLTHDRPLAAFGCFGPHPTGQAVDASAGPILTRGRPPAKLNASNDEKRTGRRAGLKSRRGGPHENPARHAI